MFYELMVEIVGLPFGSDFDSNDLIRSQTVAMLWYAYIC